MLYIYGSREWKLFSKILEVVAVSQRLQWSGIYVVRKDDDSGASSAWGMVNYKQDLSKEKMNSKCMIMLKN